MIRTTAGDSSTASIVAAVRCASYDRAEVQEAVNRGLGLLGGAKAFVQPGERILLKPNLLSGRAPERAVTTHPSVFQTVATAFQTAGATLSYGDSPGFGNPQTAAQRAGLLEVAQELGVELADFTHGEIVSFPEGRQNKQFTIARGVLNADGIVSLPKLKSHGLIVDYIGVFRDLQKALAIYGSASGGGIEPGELPVETKQALVEQLEEVIQETRDFLSQHGVKLVDIQKAAADASSFTVKVPANGRTNSNAKISIRDAG